MAAVQDVAKYFLALGDDGQSGELVSNLKLQKLAYYAQGFHLAMYGEPLFLEPIEAWQHGPVVPELYRTYRDFGPNGIPADREFDVQSLDERTRELLDEVFTVYGQFSAWRLREMTHEEAPWNETPINAEISHELLRDFFRTRVKN